MIIDGYYYPVKQWLNAPHRIEPTGSYEDDPVSGEPIFTGEYEGNIAAHFIQGNREAGKTVGVGIFLVADFLLYGYQSVLIRRYAKNFEPPDNAMSSFFGKCWDYRKEFVHVVKKVPQLQKMYPLELVENFDWDNHTIDFKNNTCVIDGKEACFPAVLYATGPNDFKEHGPFHSVYKFVYDEYIPEKDAPVIQNEITKLYIIAETAARGRKDAKRTFSLFFMSNCVTDDSVWSKAHHFKDTQKKEDHYFAMNRKKRYSLELVKNKAVTEELKNSPLGQFMLSSEEGAAYFSYSQENNTQDDYSFVEKVPGDLKYLFNVIYDKKPYAMKYSVAYDLYYFTDEGVDPKFSHSYACTRADHSLNTRLITSVLKQRMEPIKIWYGTGAMRFSSISAKNVFMDIYPLI